MGDKDPKKGQSLPDRMREAALDSAAATLAAIHMAKQVGAEVMPREDGAPGGRPLPPKLRLPLGDVLFGVAQLQVDFARRLFEFNRNASAMLRDRLLSEMRRPERPTIKVTYPIGPKPLPLCFSIRNSAGMSKTFDLRATATDTARGCDVSGALSSSRVTVPAGECSRTIEATFAGLGVGVHAGHVVVACHGIRVELLPIEVTVTKP
jgi:hypothetical protein